MIGKFCSFEHSIFFLINQGFECLICSLFDCRNAKGDSPITAADVVLLHNYAIAYLAHNNIPPTPGAKPFWDHPSVIAAIKPKYVEYLQAIAYRLKILKETPRNNFNDTIVKTVQEGLFKDFDVRKHFLDQPKPVKQDILLAMDKALCQQYGKMSKEALENIDKSAEENIQHLAALAIIELQFMRGCGIGWGTSGGGGKEASQTLADGDSGDDDDGENNGGSAKDGSGAEDDEGVDFHKIDVKNLLDERVFHGLDYPDPETFISHRESLAMATLFFLSQELGQKFPKLKDQVHAGWQAKFKKPISMDQLLDSPAVIDTSKFSLNEKDWFECTLQILVEAMSEETREGNGITAEHLKRLHIPKQPPKVSTDNNPSLCCNSSRLTLFCCCRSLPLPLVADAERNPKNRLRMLRRNLVLDEAHRRRPLTLLRRYLPRTPPPRRRRRRRRTRTPPSRPRTLSPARRRRTRSAVRGSFKITAPAARGGPREPARTSLGRSPKRRSPKRPRPRRPAAAGVPVH
jgi:hypothetical protein